MADEPASPLDDRRLLEQGAALRRLARGLIVDPGGAQDVVQQAWLAALERPAGSIRSPRAWLHGVVRHLAKRRHREEERRSRRERAAAVPDREEPADEAAARLELLRRVLAAVEALGPPYREAILWRYLDDVPVREIARRRGVPEPTVRTWLRRGLQRLRERLDDGGPESRRVLARALAPAAGFGTAEAAAGGTSALVASMGGLAMNSKVVGTVVAAAVVLGVGVSIHRTDRPRETERERATASAPVVESRGSAAAIPAGPADPVTRAEVEASPTREDPTREAWILRGRTVTEDGSPAAGVSLRLSLHDGRVVRATGGSFVEIESDDAGRFGRAFPPPGGDVTVEVAAVGAHHSTARRVHVLAGESPPQLELTVRPRDGVVTGVVRAADGRAVAGARVAAFGRDAVTDDAGRYMLAVPSGVGTASILVNAEGFAGRDETFRFPASGETIPVDVALLPEIRATGVVRDEEGRPIDGARVHSMVNAPVVATTDAAGRFDLGGLDPNSRVHFLEVAATGYLTTSDPIQPDARGRFEHAFVLERGRRLSGRVVGPGGAPLEGARVSAKEVDGHESFLAVTDAAGRFELTVSRGALRIRVFHPACAPDRRTIEGVGPEGGTLEVELGAGRSVAGRIVDERGAPIEGASAWVDWGMNTLGEVRRSDAGGRVRFTGLPADDLFVTVEARGHTTLHRVPLAPIDGEHHVWTLRRAGGLAGVVLDGRTGRPVPSFRLRIVPATLREGERRLSFFAASWTQEGMRFHAEDGRWDTGTSRLEIGAVTAIEAVAPGYAPATVDHVVVTSDPSAHAVTHRLFPPIELIGRVVRAGTGLPVVGATVRRDRGDRVFRAYESPDVNPPVTTDEHGRFVLPVPPGEMLLRVELVGEPDQVDGPFVVRADGANAERRVVVGRRGRVEGVLRSASGRASGGERIDVLGFHAGELWRTSTTTDATGRFVVEDVPGGDRFVAHVVERAGETIRTITRRVAVVDGETARVVLEATGDAAVAGRVTCSRPLPPTVRVGVTPIASGAGGSHVTLRQAFVIDGRFRIDGLEPGPHELTVTADIDGGLFAGGARVSVVAGEVAEVEVELERE